MPFTGSSGVMHMRGLAAALLMASTLIAGCSSDAPKDADDVEAGLEDLGLDATDTTGIIRGVVVDDAIKPLGGVSINVLLGAFNRTVQTNAEGLFGLDGLQPGDYFLVATKEDYKPAQTVVTVVAGEDDPQTTRLLLSIDPTTLPYFSHVQFDGFIGCSATTPTVSAAVCDMDDNVKEFTNNRFLVEYPLDGPPTWIQSEAVWSSTSATGDDLSLSLTDFSQETQRTVADARGKSPIYFTVNETVAQAYDYGTNNSLVIRVFSTTVEGTDNVDESTFQDPYADSVYDPLNSTGAPGAYQDTVVANDPACVFVFCVLNNPMGNPECLEDAVLFDSCFDVGGVGIVVNQQVTVYTTVFYGYTPPEGWRFSETSIVPAPPTIG
jgi:hypothetical protein